MIEVGFLLALFGLPPPSGGWEDTVWWVCPAFKALSLSAAAMASCPRPRADLSAGPLWRLSGNPGYSPLSG